MVVKVIISLLLSFTHPNIRWLSEKKIDNIKIQSTYKLSNIDYKKINNIYKNSKKLFSDFENLNIKSCNLSEFNIRIVSPEFINNKEIFKDNKKDVYGRYFWRQNILYITNEMFINEEYLSHELAHYFYDECFLFRGINEEEDKAYQFQETYKGIYK